MIRSVLVAVLVSLGCAGAVEPVHPVESACPRQPVCPAASEPRPAEQPAPISAPSNPVFIGGPGFWCAERPASGSDSEIVTECYRLQEACDFFREKREKAGKYFTACREAQRAACFTMGDIGVHGIGFRCFESFEYCQSERPSYVRARQDGGKKYRYTECEWTTRAELTERARRVASRSRHERRQP